MNEQSVRVQLELARRELASIEANRSAVLTLIHGYEAWLRANSYELDIQQSNAPKGEISFRQAVLTALRNEPGVPLHVHQIWHRVQAQGVVTDAKDHVSVVDAICYNLRNAGHPMIKVEPRTWAWMGQTDDEVNGRDGNPRATVGSGPPKSILASDPASKADDLSVVLTSLANERLQSGTAGGGSLTESR